MRHFIGLLTIPLLPNLAEVPAKRWSRRTLVLLICPLILFGLGCQSDRTEPSIDAEGLRLSIVDVGVSVAYLKLSIPQVITNDTIIIQRNGAIVLRIPLRSVTKLDTMLTDLGLGPDADYTYQASFGVSGLVTIKSNPAHVHTLAPTSHTFTWRTFTYGGGGTSTYWDVDIINEHDIWAVGEATVLDSTGNPIEPPFNLARWDGSRVTLSRSFESGYGYGELYAVHAFGPADVWVSSSTPEHWNGSNWTFWGTARGFPTSAWIYGLWGASSNDLYVAQGDGAIIHYAGRIWQAVRSGNDVPVHDIWGVSNPATGKEEVYCIESGGFTDAEGKILKIVDGKVDSLHWGYQQDSPLTIWTHSGFPLFVGGYSGVYENSSGQWEQIHSSANSAILDVRGSRLNDVVAVGTPGVIAHFNGIDWKIIGRDAASWFTAVAIQGNTIAVAGTKNGRALLMIGTRP